jgi:hypothetical protein
MQNRMPQGQRRPTRQELERWVALMRQEAGMQVDVRRHAG